MTVGRVGIALFIVRSQKFGWIYAIVKDSPIDGSNFGRSNAIRVSKVVFVSLKNGACFKITFHFMIARSDEQWRRLKEMLLEDREELYVRDHRRLVDIAAAKRHDFIPSCAATFPRLEGDCWRSSSHRR